MGIFHWRLLNYTLWTRSACSAQSFIMAQHFYVMRDKWSPFKISQLWISGDSLYTFSPLRFIFYSLYPNSSLDSVKILVDSKTILHRLAQPFPTPTQPLLNMCFHLFKKNQLAVIQTCRLDDFNVNPYLNNYIFLYNKIIIGYSIVIYIRVL